MILLVNSHNFQKEVLDCPYLVMVNFWVNWSNECKRMRSLIKELEQQLDEHYKIVEVNWEIEKQLADKYQVYGVPSLLVFEKGKLVGRYSGTLDAKTFLKECSLLKLKSC